MTGIKLLLSLMLVPLASWSICVHSAEPVIQVYIELRDDTRLEMSSEGLRVNTPATRLLDAIMLEAGLRYELTVNPWSRILQILDSTPNIIAYPVARLAEREERWLWIGGFWTPEYNLFGLAEKLESLPADLESAKALRIGTFKGDVIDTYLQSKGFENLIHITEPSNALLLLLRDRFDLVAMDQRNIDQSPVLRNIPEQRVVPVIPLPEISQDLYFSLSAGSDPELLERLQTAYASVVGSGQYQEIMGMPDK